MNMKQITSLILSAALILSCCAALFCSCADNGAQNDTTNTSLNTEQTNITNGTLGTQAVDSNFANNKNPKYSFIGNSLTFYGDTDRIFNDLLTKNGYNPQLYSALKSGYSLDTHASDYVLDINSTKENMDYNFADTDIVIMQDYGSILTPHECYKVIFSKLNKNAKIYYFQTYFNTGIYPSIVREADWDSSDDSGNIGLWRKYVRGEKLTDDEAKSLYQMCYLPKASEYCAKQNYLTIPAGHVLDKLVIEKSADEPELNLNNLILSDRTHQSDLLAYINALTFYYVIYGEIPIEKDTLYYYTEGDPTDKLINAIKDTIKSAVDEYFAGKTFEQRFIAEYANYIQPIGEDINAVYAVPQTILDKHKDMDYATYMHLKGNLYFMDQHREIVKDYMDTTDEDVAKMSESDIQKRLDEMNKIKTDFLDNGTTDRFYSASN